MESEDGGHITKQNNSKAKRGCSWCLRSHPAAHR